MGIANLSHFRVPLYFDTVVHCICWLELLEDFLTQLNKVVKWSSMTAAYCAAGNFSMCKERSFDNGFLLAVVWNWHSRRKVLTRRYSNSFNSHRWIISLILQAKKWFMVFLQRFYSYLWTLVIVHLISCCSKTEICRYCLGTRCWGLKSFYYWYCTQIQI